MLVLWLVLTALVSIAISVSLAFCLSSSTDNLQLELGRINTELSTFKAFINNKAKATKLIEEAVRAGVDTAHIFYGEDGCIWHRKDFGTNRYRYTLSEFTEKVLNPAIVAQCKKNHDTAQKKPSTKRKSK